MKKVIAILAVLGSLVSAGQARADVVISADNLPSAVYAYVGSYDYQGFTLSGPDLYQLAPNYWGPSIGANTFANAYPYEIAQVTKDGGGAFAVTSIDISQLYPNSVVITSATPVTFYGALLGGGTVTQTVTLGAGTYGLQTFTLTGFSDITSFSFYQTPDYNQFSNIVVSASAVPEPSSLALLGLGGIGSAITAFRRRRLDAAA